jgi:hypothetical protein
MFHDLAISAVVTLIVISPKLVAAWFDRRQGYPAAG